MIKHNPETEMRIKSAAREIFLKYGKDGARMQMIADKAGVNKALVHYYFRSKERLFYEIIKDSFNDLFDFVKSIPEDIPFKQFLKMFIDAHIDFVKANYQLMMFIFWEFRQQRQESLAMIAEIKQSLAVNPKDFLKARINKAIQNGEIKPIQPFHFILNLLGLDIFPFLIQPVFQFVFDLDEQTYLSILDERKEEVFRLLWNSIKPEHTGE